MAAKYKEFTEYRVIKIGIIGNSYIGKTFILSKLSKFKLCFYIKVKSLSIKYPELEKYSNKKIVFFRLYFFRNTNFIRKGINKR